MIHRWLAQLTLFSQSLNIRIKWRIRLLLVFKLACTQWNNMTINNLCIYLIYINLITFIYVFALGTWHSLGDITDWWTAKCTNSSIGTHTLLVLQSTGWTMWDKHVTPRSHCPQHSEQFAVKLLCERTVRKKPIEPSSFSLGWVKWEIITP